MTPLKNRRALIFSLVCGLFAILLTGYYVSQKEKYFSAKFEEIYVVTAKKDILRYEVIDETMLNIRAVPKPFVQPLAITAKDRDRIVGYVADATIKEGEQITETRIARPGESRISITIPKNERGCTVAVNEISGVAGLIRPGDHVDILGTFKTVDQKTRIATQAETVTLFQNLSVLAVGRNYVFEGTPGMQGSRGIIPDLPTGGAGFSNVTLSVTPRQCMDLTLSQQVGTLTLSLRSYLNRFGGETSAELREKHSTPASATGIQQPLEITARPRWLEMRGEQSLVVP